MANVLQALMMGIAGGAQGYTENRRYKQERADRESEQAFERQMRENQFKQQLVQAKNQRDYQQTMLDLTAKSGAQRAATDEAELALRNRQEENQKHDRGIAAVLDQAKLSGYIPASPDAELAAQQFGGTVRPIAEVLEAARTQANSTRRNVDIPGQGTVVYGYNPNDSSTASMYNARSDELRGFIDGMTHAGEQAKNAILHQYRADDPLFPLDETTRAKINMMAEQKAQQAADRYADNVYNTKGLDINGKHKRRPGGTTPPTEPNKGPTDWRAKYGVGDSPPSPGSAGATPGSAVPYESFFK